MPFKKLSKFLFAMGGALVLTATSASAHTGHATTFTTSDSSVNAYPDTTSSITYGAYEADDMTVDFQKGMRFAHADGYGTEVSPNPNDDELVGTASATAKFVFSACLTATITLDAYWEEDMTGAPSGAVAHYRVVSSLGTIHAWVIEEDDATDDYKITMDLDETWTCSSQPSTAKGELSTKGTTASGGHPGQNPSTAGCYTVVTTFNDTSGGTHSGSTTSSVGGASC